MDKKKMILTSLASVTVLGAVFAVSQPSVVKADAPTATSTSGETGATPVVKTPKTEVEKAKEDLTETIENLTDDAEKLKADAEKKAEIGKEAILDSVEKGYLSAKDVLKELENDYNTRNKAPKKEASKPIVKNLQTKLMI
ncbi:hypothetical protein [Streptococcus mitis]|uniref:hypothetical protein n=1 Tax=Streptococcus mitis TaxID=28037 RepID=UPI0021B62E5E|nr:hypothetical protein [Streptococcus mitis]